MCNRTVEMTCQHIVFKLQDTHREYIKTTLKVSVRETVPKTIAVVYAAFFVMQNTCILQNCASSTQQSRRHII